MTRALRSIYLAALLLIPAGIAVAQPTFTITNVKDACAGNNNGSFDVNVVTANGPVTILVIGPPNFTRFTSAGLTESFTGLKPQNYIIVVQDDDGSNIALQSIINVAANISFLSAPVVVNNSSCSAPNGSINITPTGGSGAYIYSWSGPGAFTSSSQNLSGLAGGSYIVTITNPTTSCSFTSGAIDITDPSPSIQTVSTTSPENLCTGDNATISLTSTQVLTLPGSYYEILKNGSPTGVKASGTGAPLTLTLPSGSFVNGDVLTVRAVDGLCTPTLMTGSVTVSLHASPTNATINGTATICSGTSTNLSVTITGGTGPYTITVNNGVGTINNYASGAAIPVSPVATTTYNVTAVTDANGCPAQALSGSAVVTVKSSPTSAVLSGSAALCAGAGPTNLIVTVTGGTSPYSVTINNGVGTINNYVSGTPIPVNPGATTTYSIVGNVTDANGCGVAGSGSATVTINTPPSNATISGNATICSATSTNLSVAVTGGVGPYTVTINNGVGTINNYVSGTPIPVSPLATTTYNVTAVTDANGCAALALSGSAVVTVKASPTSAVLSGTATLCAGAGPTNLAVTITGGTSPYTVTIDNGVGTINNYVSGTPIPVNPGATTTYSIVGNVTDANGCGVAGSGSATVTVNTPPSNATIAGTATICSGTSTNLSITITGGTGPYTVTVNNGVGTINNYVSGTSIPVSPAATTTYNVTAVADANGCPAQALSGSAVVTVKASPTSAVLSGNATLCAGAGPTNLIVTVTGGTSPYTVTINNGVGTINNYVSGTPIPVNPGATTTYSIVGNVTDANGCGVAGTGSATVTINTPPSNATITGTATICSGTSTNLVVTIIGGSGPYNVTINNGVGTINNYVSGTAIPVSPLATTTYSVTAVTDANGCPAQALSGSAVVTVNASPTSAVLSGTAVICSGAGPANLIVTITGGTSPYNISINNGVGSIANYVSGTPIPVNPGVTTTYAMVGSVTDANGCGVAGSGSATITINTPPSDATISGNATICPGSNTNLSVALTGGTGPFSITINNGVGTINNYVSGTPIAVSPFATTTYSLTAAVDANGCSAQALSGSAVVTVNPGVVSAVLGGNATICGGAGSASLSVTITGGVGPYNVTINNGVGTINNYVSGTPILVSPAATTTYSTVGLITDTNGCGVAGTGTATVTVNAPPSNATISGTAAVCQGSSTNLMVTITGGTGPYMVSIDNGVGTINNYVSGTPIPVTPAGATTYSVTSVVDANGCSALALSGSAVITTNTPPSDAFLSGNATICVGTATNIAVAFTGGTGPYTVTIDNGVGTINNYASGAPISVTPAATTVYHVTAASDANGCASQALSGSAAITVTPLPTATISGGTSICVGGSSTISIALTGTGPWDISYSDGSTTTPVAGVTTSPYTFNVSPLFSTNYTMVSVTDATGCGAGTVNGTASVTVTAIAGNPATFGIDTWLGYVYDDSGDPTPLPARIDFNNTKYRGVIDETDMAAMSPFSTYNSATDEFDVNISNNASGFNIHSSNVCGTYVDDFSIRYRMRKTFAKGVYTFTVGTDDGARLFVDGVNVIPGAFINQAYTKYNSAAICLSAGSHDLVLEYYERSGFSRLSFNYQLSPAPTVATPVSVCINSAAPVLAASSADPAVIGFNWYKDAALTTLLFAGANFTPSASDLDVTTLGTTSFYVTSLYACGETVASQVDVTVINSATITPPAAPAQVCQSAGIIDLSTIVTAVPAGGSFTFSGTGVTSSPNFDPTLVAGSTLITVSYTSGTCTANTNFTLNVVNLASITVPASPVSVCQTGGTIDMTTLVSAVPAGGAFTFTGPGVAGNMFDPSGQSGAVAITVDYNAGGCLDSKTLNFDVLPTATLTTSNTSTCPTAGLVDLSTLVSGVPGAGIFTFTGPSVVGTLFDPTTHGGTTVNITVGYNVGGCTASGTISVTVSPTCGTNCGVFSALITDTRPTCANQNDGIININVSGGTPNYVVTLTDGGAFNQSLPGPGPLFSFTNLSPANYFYTIQDNGGNTCTLPHTLPLQTSVQAVASNFIDAICFNQPVGGATVTVTSGGTAPYEYSTDGGSTWVVFTSPVAINNLMPSVSPYSILVRDDAADQCPAQVMVTIGNAVLDITAVITPSAATCANNDGTITIGAIAGGTAPYTFELDGVPYATLPAGNVFNNLSGGNHIFTVIDANSCRKDIPVIVTFPGLVNFTTSSTAPDCSGNGTNGTLTVTILSSGSFQVGISPDPVVPPTVFQDVISVGAQSTIFTNLSSGTYYVTAQAIGAQCPTVSAATVSGGPQAVNFQLTADNIVCFGDPGGGATLQAITGAPATDYTYQVLQAGNVVQNGVITSTQALSTVPVTGLAKGDYQIILSQDQSATSGCPVPLTSPVVSFTVAGPLASLDTLYVNRLVSYPDLASGSMTIGVQESGAEPYELKLELTQPLFPSQGPYVLDWTTVPRNPQNLKVEYLAKSLFAGQYTLSLRDSLGCVRTYPITLDVYSNIDIPNIFTPNGDGVNDVFYIRNLPAASAVVVTNRWGKEVFSTGDYQNDWSGSNIDDGIYYYRVKAAGQVFNGWVEIQRATGGQ